MRNIRLYIGGKRADLDESTSVPFTFQTTDAEMPTAVKNSYSKTITLQGTDTNRRLFGGIWHLDSKVITGIPAVTAPFNQLVQNGNFADSSNWALVNAAATLSISGNVATLTATGTDQRTLIRQSISLTGGHKIYYSYMQKETTAVNLQGNHALVYTPAQFLPTPYTSDQDIITWTKFTGVATLANSTAQFWVGRYGRNASHKLLSGDKVFIKNVMLCDLTEIYGAGNEPTAAEFEAKYGLDRVDYLPYTPIGGQIELSPAQTGDIGIFFNPMKRVDFQLYVDEMVVERGYCQLTAINRKGRDYTFSVSLFGGLGEFFYNLQTDSDGEKRSLADLDYGSDLGFKINATEVQSNWDTLLGGTLPSIAFVPMHNGVPKTISGDKMLIKGGGLPTSTSDGYTTKSGYLLASLERKYTEWEVGDLRSYLQRPALRVKDFIDAICDPANNGGWKVNLDSDFFDSTNPYYWNTYLLLPQLNVEEETEDICDDGSITPVNDYPTTSTKTKNLTPVSGCMTISGNYVDMSAYASNAYLKLSLPVQLALTGQANVGNLYMTNRVSHHTENKTICVMAVAWDEEGNMVGVSNRYVFTSKSHRNETGDVKKPSAPYATTDAQIDGYFAYSGGEYKFRLDDYNSDTFALTIDKIQRPSSALHKVRVNFYIQMTTEGIPTLNIYRYGDNVGNVYVSNTQFDIRILSGSNNTLTLVEPTQYATDSQVSQDSLFGALEATPLEILLSYTKRFGLMWIQENSEKEVSVFARKNYYTGEVKDIHNLIDYSKGLKVTPVAAESNNYVLGDQTTESTLAEAYLSRYGRNYGEVRLKVGYDFGKEKVEMMEKCEFTEVVDGALSGSGYWAYRNADGNLPSAIADGMKVTYYKESGGTTDTKDLDYNLFNVTGIEKKNSPALGCASKTDDGEETAEEVAPALVFFQGGKVDGTWHLTDDNTAMALLNNSPCWLWDESLAAARVPRFGRVATFSGETYSLDFGTPRETFYIPEVSLAPEQAIYARWWERYLIDLLSKDTKKAECYVVFPPHLDMRHEMRKFYLFDRSLWVLNKVTDYDATKVQPVKCEFIRVTDKEAYTSY